MLDPAQRAVGVAGTGSQFRRNQSGLSRQPQQRDVAEVAHQHRMRACVAKHQILRDEFDVDHAAAVVLQVEPVAVVRVAGVDFLAHRQDFFAQRGGIARQHQDVLADLLEARSDACVSGGMACPGQRLVFPGPGVLVLVLLEGFHGHGQKSRVAVRPQAQVHLVQPS
ncbi:hypothetical protein D3C86_1682180 [compost metagenome]